MTLPAEFYRHWRAQGGAVMAIRDARRQGGPPERWLQEVWAHQRLKRDDLRTTGGRRVLILHPGFWNREAGPDFRGAVVQFDDALPMSGDVEIDVVPGGWTSHGHAANPAYANVVLHVVWAASAGSPTLPTLALEPHLDAPVDELEQWVGGAGDTPAEWLRGHCSAPLRALPGEAIAVLLQQAAWVRLQTKALLFRARARSAGWAQALWEGLFRALGYKHNAWPMQRVAEMLPLMRDQPVESADPRESWEARLLGVSGLLPLEPRPGTHARRLWDLWWRERAALGSQTLPSDLWRLHGVRPANHPQRRLAVAAAWLAQESWVERIEEWFRGGQRLPEAERTLETVLRPFAHSFWRRHYTLNSRAIPGVLPMLGSGRMTDLAVNAVLPWLYARAEAGGESPARQAVQDLYMGWPAGEDNTVLKLARARLFGTDLPPVRRSASAQQGLLQIVRDFCGYSNALCERCAFPSLVGSLKNPAGGE